MRCVNTGVPLNPFDRQNTHARGSVSQMWQISGPDFWMFERAKASKTQKTIYWFEVSESFASVFATGEGYDCRRCCEEEACA